MSTLSSSAPTVVDAAGGHMGGAAKLLGELTRYLADRQVGSVSLIGLDRSLEPDWLVRRELLGRGAARRVALNNVGFTSGPTKVTLLRNALHFASAQELSRLAYTPSRTLRVQTQLVRMAARRSDVLVVPCDAMAERVTRHAPHLADRLKVRFHPVSQADWAGGHRPARDTHPTVLVPVLNAPYKRLDQHLRALLDAVAKTRASATVVMTAHAHEFGDLATHPGVRFTGPLPRPDLEECWRQASAVYFPTQLESFGYPLAEARVNGIPVIAPDSEQNRQIGGPALRPFFPGRPDTLASALHDALADGVDPDPAPFSPRQYFDWLLGAAC